VGDERFEISGLTEEDKQNLDAARTWVKGHFTENADEKYEPVDGKLRVIDAILANKWVNASETDKLQALGVALGDALAQELLLDWVVIDDELGRSPCLSWPGTSINCYPLTMISKRIEDGEDVSVYDLFDGMCARLREMAFSGDMT
jgi:hypothetical protein